ncbi:DUF1002 domain-containing protein [Virgibacillus sp. NKC19-16]|uniref:DUF1002 domain-containing protein n=1 Tax=Virgibacillus salidurans TaxID=2831673 RepID=UPI001F192D19|nr:DUF1002 domain-containing protein [Virgibacillus sp. NKC19-16]UJL46113.1 DUF1002 domain-containing protein [Virgibacillus sp. NKC19-16]
MKHKLKAIGILLLIAVLTIGLAVPVNATSGSIVVYGEQLTDEQRTEVREILEVSDTGAVQEYDVTGEDYANYINGNPNANMYSSAKITLEDSGEGLTVNIATPDNITEVTNEMYANALLTAGVENATVDVASPAAVTGHSALTGIYKAYDAEGEELDKERMELANDELNVATDLAEEEGMSQEKVSELLTEIKQMIADQDPATREDVEQIVQEQLDNLEVSLSEADRQMLVDLFDKMRDLEIDFDQVRSQLEDIASTVRDQMDELGLDASFWEKVGNFFADLFESISNLFR